MFHHDTFCLTILLSLCSQRGQGGGLSIRKLWGMLGLFSQSLRDDSSQNRCFNWAISFPNHSLVFYITPSWELRSGNKTYDGSHFFVKLTISNWKTPRSLFKGLYLLYFVLNFAQIIELEFVWSCDTTMFLKKNHFVQIKGRSHPLSPHKICLKSAGFHKLIQSYKLYSHSNSFLK